MLNTQQICVSQFLQNLSKGDLLHASACFWHIMLLHAAICYNNIHKVHLLLLFSNIKHFTLPPCSLADQLKHA